MELLIAVLIGLGVVTSGDSAAVNELIEKNSISQKQIDDQTAIIEMEDDM